MFAVKNGVLLPHEKELILLPSALLILWFFLMKGLYSLVAQNRIGILPLTSKVPTLNNGRYQDSPISLLISSTE